MHFIRYIIYFFFAAIVLLSCRKDDMFFETTGGLNFSSDTIMFDTIFTTIGSTTRRLKVYNPHNKTILISSIKLSGGSSSQFRINIDGLASHEAKDIELAAKDSMYIFVRVTVDPTNSNTPFVVSDSLFFEANNKLQQVKLVAWGQNAYYHTPTFHPYNMSPYSVINSNTTWQNDKPHLVYGWVVVDSSYSLTIEEGSQIHFHNNSGIWVYNDATLIVSGTLNAPVVFQGDRMEAWYKDLPGQWGRLMYNGYLFSMGIWLSAGSIDNVIDYAIIRNGDTGIKVDTVGNSFNPTLRIKNTIIENMSTSGIYAQGSHIEGENLVISNAGLHALILSIGGSYNFKHSTFANYWSYSTRQTASVVINNYYKDVNNQIQLRDLTEAYFGNCIIYGPLEEELHLDANNQAQFNYFFDHCLLKTGEPITDANHFLSSIKNLNPQFKDSGASNFQLQSSSPALNIGSPTIGSSVPFDILGVSRTSQPDLGAYERE